MHRSANECPPTVVTSEPAFVDESPTPTDTTSTLPRGAFGFTPGGLGVLTAATLLTFVFVPAFVVPTWSPRYVVLVGLLPVGLVALAGLVRRRDKAAVFAAAFLAVTLLSSLRSSSPMFSIAGRVGHQNFWLFFAFGIATWAIGRIADDRTVHALPVVVVVATIPNIFIGVAQLVFDVGGGTLATIAGRATGTMVNPVYYGSALAGTTSYCVVRAVRDSSWRWVALSGVLTFGMALSGSRVSTAAIVLVVLVCAVQNRKLVSLYVAAAVVAGFAAASVLSHVASDTDTLSRFGSKGADGRVDIWRYGLDAFGEHPILGWGPSRFGSAVRPKFAASFVRDYAYDDQLISWDDPHNIVIMLLVATGAVGFLLMVGFLLAHTKLIADWGLFAMFAGAGLTWMAQPTTIHSMPIAMLALGACARRLAPRMAGTDRVDSVDGAWVGRLALASVALGISAAGYVAVTDLRLQQGLERGAVAAEAAARWRLPDPVVSDTIADMYSNAALDDAQYLDDAIAASERTIEIDPRGRYWAKLARRQLSFKRYDDAKLALDQALAIEPWNPTAWQVQLAYAIIVHDEALEEQSRAVVCDLDLYACTTGARAGVPADEPS